VARKNRVKSEERERKSRGRERESAARRWGRREEQRKEQG
jgi:hypothetical protein